MIISDSCKFVFVHIPRNAGSSVRVALKPFGDDQWAGSRLRWHEMLPALISRHPELKTHFKFAFVRNPWERVVSLFCYAKETMAPTYPPFQAMESLETMLRQFDRTDSRLRMMHFIRPQCEYVCGEDGQWLTDFVGRYENLDADFAPACRRIGITAALPQINASGRRGYARYYNSWCRDFVAARYARDIEEFGYAFGDPS